MSGAARLAAFVAGLAAVLATTFAAGAAFGPDDPPGASRPSPAPGEHTEHEE